MDDDMFPDAEWDLSDLPESAQHIHNEQGYHNERYQMLLGNFMRCTTEYMNQFPYAQHLEKQLTRLDLDTVCAYEMYQMKQAFTKDKTLDLSQFYNKE